MASREVHFLLGVIAVLGCSGSKVLHHGSKVFWRIRCAADVVIIHHPQHEVIEVVAYDVKNEIEAPHIFLDTVLLDAKLKSNKELSPDELKTARVSFVMRRINAVNDSKEFAVKLAAIDSDWARTDGTLEEVCPCPKSLVCRDYHKIVKKNDNSGIRRKWRKPMQALKMKRRVTPIKVETINEDDGNEENQCTVSMEASLSVRPFDDDEPKSDEKIPAGNTTGSSFLTEASSKSSISSQPTIKEKDKLDSDATAAVLSMSRIVTSLRSSFSRLLATNRAEEAQKSYNKHIHASSKKMKLQQSKQKILNKSESTASIVTFKQPSSPVAYRRNKSKHL